MFWVVNSSIEILINVQKSFMGHLRTDVASYIPWSQAWVCVKIKTNKNSKCQGFYLVFCFNIILQPDGTEQNKHKATILTLCCVTVAQSGLILEPEHWEILNLNVVYVCRFLWIHAAVTNKMKWNVNEQPVRVLLSLECDAEVCVALVLREIFCKECNYLRGRLA